MKVAVIAAISGFVILCGCAGNRTYRPGPGGGAVTAPGPSTNLGLPSPAFGSPGNSSSYGPSRGGPALLGLPGPLTPATGRQLTTRMLKSRWDPASPLAD